VILLLCVTMPGNSSNDKPFAGVKGAKMYGTITKLNLSNNNIHALGIKVTLMFIDLLSRNLCLHPPSPSVF
jgi:hypothetical protein